MTDNSKNSFNGTISFAEDQWDPSDWLPARSPRWQTMSHWLQRPDCIANHTPEDIRPEDIQMGRDRAGETYISMLYRQPFHGNTVFHTHCAFDERMAPLLVFSPELSGIHHEHLEVVLYDHGINLWHHYYHDGKPSWKLISCLALGLNAGQKYDLSAQFIFNRKGIFLIMGCEGSAFGCRLDTDFPQTYYAGITACEGKNRFFDFSAESAPVLPPALAERFSD